MTTLILTVDGVEIHSKGLSLKYPENIEKYSQMKRDEGMTCVSRRIVNGYIQLWFVYDYNLDRFFALKDNQSEIPNNVGSTEIVTIDI